MNNFEDVKFKITTINIERSLEGDTHIEATSQCAREFKITIVLRSRYAQDKDIVRRLLIEEYVKHLALKEIMISVGDVI